MPAKATSTKPKTPVKKPLPKRPAKKRPATKNTVLPGSAEAGEFNLPATPEQVSAARLAQMVNLHIGGFSLDQIGQAIGCSAAEVDRMLSQDVGRYVKSQPALRVYVRNFISEKYLGLLDSVYPQATDKTNKQQLEYQDRALRTLAQMAKLHGAEMPTQSEVKVDAAPEMVEAMVEVLSRQKGQGYDDSIFDVIDAEVVTDAHDQAVDALEEASLNVPVPTEDDEDF
jgi:hypothetical protein